jgi:ADP-ribose pyrophosphatase YjhB (NUDIX family)
LNPPIAAGVVAERADGKILLVLRGENPGKGLWGLPAGFMEIDETVEQAARRECLEETGLDVELRDLLGIWSYYHDPKQTSGVVVLYAARLMEIFALAVTRSRRNSFDRRTSPTTACVQNAS